MNKKRGNNLFNDSWLSDDRFKSWLQKDSGSTAKCKLCCKTFSVLFFNFPVYLYKDCILHILVLKK